MTRQRPAAIVRRLPRGSRVAVAGRLVARDDRGGRLRDQTGEVPLIFADGSDRADAPERPPLGALLRVSGVWDGASLDVDSLDLGQVPPSTYPTEGSDHAWFMADDGRRMENLRRRAAVLGVIRGFFDQRGFVEVETPTLVRSPGTEVHLEAFRVPGASERFLITSPELHMKRLLGAGFERIYQVTRAYRRDEAGGLHEPEFSMLEWYRAFAGAEELMADTEALVAAVAVEVVGESALTVGGRVVDVTPPWPRVRVDEALRRFAGRELSELLEDETEFYRTWIDSVEPELSRDRATFVTHYPAQMASLARLRPDEPAFADRFEAYVGGVELCNGFGELVDAAEQRSRMEQEARVRAERGMDEYPIDERFLAALEEGLPESGGNALGVDRLVMMACGESEIGEVIAFPRERA